MNPVRRSFRFGLSCSSLLLLRSCFSGFFSSARADAWERPDLTVTIMKKILILKMSDRVPGPVCSTRVGGDWVDDGTLCRAKSSTPGPVIKSAAKSAYDSAHGYSLAPEARRKRAIDLQIIGGDYSRSAEIRIDNGDYLKKLIEIGSSGKQKVLPSSRDLQFFIVRGGAEGFLPPDLRTVDANNNVTHWPSTDGKQGQTDFDENDLLAVFDSSGGLISSARLRRPTFVETRLRRQTAARVYDSWDGKTVFIYRNAQPGWIPYLGLALDDGFRDGSANEGQRVLIDLHKEEQTNGCIFIVDDTTPAIGTPELHTFEPTLIKKILTAKGIDEAKLAKGRITLGKMSVIAISF